MNRFNGLVLGVAVCLLLGVGVQGRAQTAADSPSASATVGASTQANPQAIVPRLMKFSGVLRDSTGKPLSGAVDVTFALYASDASGDPLWFETQSVQADALGRYSILLGAMHTEGLPVDLFTSGEVRWLGIQVGQEAEQQPRVMLVSVPYALKAGDAETLGGKPASAYMLSGSLSALQSAGGTVSAAGTIQAGGSGQEQSKSPSANQSPLTACPSITSDGTATPNSVTKFTAACNIQNSAITEMNGNVGVGTVPASLLHLSAASPELRFTSTDPSAVPQLSFYDGGNLGGFFQYRNSGAPSPKEFRLGGFEAGSQFTIVTAGTERVWVDATGNVGIGTTTPTALLEVNGAAQFDQPVTFASGQSFSTTSGTGTFTDSTSNQVLDVNQTGSGAAAVLNTTGTGNILTGEKNGTPVFSVDNSGNITTSGNLNILQTPTGGAAGVVTMAGLPFIHACCGTNYNTFIGIHAGNFSTTGNSNTASGSGALVNVTDGNQNTASGVNALFANTQGSYNTASGTGALILNDSGVGDSAFGTCALRNTFSGSSGTPSPCTLPGLSASGGNTAVGVGAGQTNTTGFANTFLGYNADANFGDWINATAIGANAVVGANNAIVLGCTSTSCSSIYFAPPSVGIGTSTPAAPLHVNTTAGYLVGLIQSSNALGTWLALDNTSTGGIYWSLISTGSSDAGGAGNLEIGHGTNLNSISPVMTLDSSTGRVGIGTSTPGYTLDVSGTLNVSGAITAGTKDFKIDDPIDPEHKDLYHASVESSEMMNMYTGNVITDAHGDAVVELPAWFQALNVDFRYQLTVIGQFAQAIVAQEIQSNRFTIKSDKPGVKVSWLVTGVRHDAWALANRLNVEVKKPERAR